MPPFPAPTTVPTAKIDQAAYLLGAGQASNITMDGKPSLRVGNGSAKAVVYAPTCDEQALRNLNFARVNLAAYLAWQKGAAARAFAAKVKKDESEKAARIRARYERRGLAALNDQKGTNHKDWAAAFWPRSIDQDVVDAWTRLVKNVDASWADSFRNA